MCGSKRAIARARPRRVPSTCASATAVWRPRNLAKEASAKRSWRGARGRRAEGPGWPLPQLHAPVALWRLAGLRTPGPPPLPPPAHSSLHALLIIYRRTRRRTRLSLRSRISAATCSLAQPAREPPAARDRRPGSSTRVRGGPGVRPADVFKGRWGPWRGPASSGARELLAACSSGSRARAQRPAGVALARVRLEAAAARSAARRRNRLPAQHRPSLGSPPCCRSAPEACAIASAPLAGGSEAAVAQQ